MRRRLRGTPVPVLVVLVALAGCGGAGKAKEASADGEEERPAAEGSATTTTAKGGGKPSSGKQQAGAEGATTTTTTAKGAGPAAPGKKDASADDDPDRWKEPLDMTLRLSEECVRPGGTQTVTIDAPVGTGVGYNTYYADGKSGLSEGFYGGNNGGFVDETGTWTDTFTVAPNAPAGQAVVWAMGTGSTRGRGEEAYSFYVSDLTGTCHWPDE